MPTFPTPRAAYFGNPAVPDHLPDKNDLVRLFEQVQAIATTQVLTGFVAAIDDLPDTGNETDDRYAVMDVEPDGGIYEWDGSEWGKISALPVTLTTDEFALLARAWAANPEDQEVADGLFSALHYAAKGAASADLSQLWAESEGEEPGGAGTKSSREWAGDAEGFASAALVSEGIATTQAGIATSAATAASLSEQQAQAAAVLAGAPIAEAFPTDDTETDALPSPFLFIAPEGVQSWTHDGTFASLDQGPYAGRVAFESLAAFQAYDGSDLPEGLLIETREIGLSFVIAASAATDFTFTLANDQKARYVESAESALRLWHRHREGAILARAGCPEGVRLGPQAGITPGLSDESALAAATDTPILITSPAEMASAADSGAGTYQNPYIIRDRYLATEATGLNIAPGFRINDAANQYHVVLENCRLEGWSRGLIRLTTAPGSTIEIRHCRLDYGTANISNNNRRMGIVNNADGDEAYTADPRGTRVIVRNSEIYCELAGVRPESANRNGWNCSTEVYDSIGYGAVWWVADEGNTAILDLGDRRLKVHRYSALRAYGDGDNFGIVNANAPGTFLDAQRIKIEWAEGEQQAPAVLARPVSQTRIPARRKPVVLGRYIKVPLTEKRGIDLQWFDEGSRLEYITVDQMGNTRRGIQFGISGNVDPLRTGIGATAWRCRVNGYATAGGAFAENILHDHCDTMRFLECAVVQHVPNGGDDAIESYGPQGAWEVADCVVYGVPGQALDAFTNNSTRPPAEAPFFSRVYGTCRGEAVQLTQVNGAVVEDILVQTGLGGTQTSQVVGTTPAQRALVMAWSRFADGEASKNISLHGMMTNSWNIGDATQGAVFAEIQLSPGSAFDGSNKGIYAQDFDLTGYNVTQEEIAAFKGR